VGGDVGEQVGRLSFASLPCKPRRPVAMALIVPRLTPSPNYS